MGINEIFCSSEKFMESLDTYDEREDIPLKLNESLAEKKIKEYYRLYAIALCIVSIIITIILCILAIVFASLRHSPATFAFAADCALDLLSSIIVIWRYFGSPYKLCSPSRELKACISLGILFIVAGIGVICEGIYFLHVKELPKWFTILVILAAVGCFVCVVLGVAKFILSKKLQSETLFLDGLNSLLSALFALVIIVGDVAYVKNKNLWYLDPMMSIILSIGLIAFGLRTIVIHTRHFGYVSHGNG